ncbi:MAG: hypothetical protein KAH16_04130 [Candidatus Izimaplasma sp.]|nr:hypothetical protein [Candidatus Izimaplasma bacterium]
MKYTTMLPFMDKEELKELAYQVINKEVKGVNIIVLFPFLDCETLDEIVEKLIETNNSKALRGAVPFVQKSTINKIYEAVKSGQLKDFKEEYLLPFLGKDQIKAMFRDLIKKASDEYVEEENDDEEDDE